MSALLKAALIIVCLAVCSEAATRTAAVYAEMPSAFQARSIETLQNELRILLGPARIDLDWKNLKQARSGDNFDIVAIGSFDGSCSVSDLPAETYEDAGSLADTSITDGNVLPYFRVNCPQLIRILTPVLHALPLPAREALLTRALARVIAHEIYHIVARTAAHHDSGIAKRSFSLGDLTTAKFGFDPSSLAEMEPAAETDDTDSRNLIAVTGPDRLNPRTSSR